MTEIDVSVRSDSVNGASRLAMETVTGIASARDQSMKPADRRLQATLMLADGTRFVGWGMGRHGHGGGELVFTTAMTGYQEALTDPSYRGQILMFTYPLIGNYGVAPGRAQSGEVQARAADRRDALQ